MKHNRIQLVILFIILTLIWTAQSQDDEAYNYDEEYENACRLAVAEPRPDYYHARNLLMNCSHFHSPQDRPKEYECYHKVIECCEMICPTEDCSIEVTNIHASALEEIDQLERSMEHPFDGGECTCRMDENASSVLSKYNEIIGKNSSDAAALNDRGVFLGKKCCFREALESFNESIRTNHRLAEPWYNKGVLLYYEQPLEALECFNQSVQIEPGFALAWFNRCSLLSAFDTDINSISGREAKLSYNIALQLMPELEVYIPPKLEYRRIV